MQRHGDMFSPEFLAIDPAVVVRSINEQGYFCFPSAVNATFLEQLQNELQPHVPAINVNDVGPVWFNEQYFFPHALACSRRYFDYVTAEALRAICDEKFGRDYRLKCHRYYETGPGHSMEWHADNVTNEGVVTDSNGLIFILYVNDVFDGEFQLVADSYKARKEGDWSYNYTNAYVESTFGPKIKTFSMPAGSLIVYDTYGIHRAKPIISKSFTRKSIFFQVDASDLHAEKILLNPSFLDNRDDRLFDYLGFGKSQEFPTNPTSTVRHVPLRRLVGMQLSLTGAALYRVKYGAFQLLPHDARMRYRRWRKGVIASMRRKHPGAFKLMRRSLGRPV